MCTKAIFFYQNQTEQVAPKVTKVKQRQKSVHKTQTLTDADQGAVDAHSTTAFYLQATCNFTQADQGDQAWTGTKQGFISSYIGRYRTTGLDIHQITHDNF